MSGAAHSRLLVLLAALLFSTGGAAIKATSLTIWQVGGLRSGIAAIALACLLPSWRRGITWRAAAVGIAYAATMLLYVAGNKLTSAANVIFLQSTAPLYLLFLGPWFLSEPVRRRELGFGLALAVGMALFFVGSEASSATAPSPQLGNILGGLAGLSWAWCILGLRLLGRSATDADREASGGAVILGNAFACLASLPFAFPFSGITPADAAVVSYLGLFQIGLAYVCLTRGIRRLSAIEAALLLLLEPVLNTLWALLVHGELPGPWSLAGCLLILSATVLNTLFGAKAD